MTPTLRIVTVGLLVASVLLYGCHVDTREQVLMRHEPNDRPTTRRAPYDGQYRLYVGAARHPTTRSSTALLDRALRKGAAIGFVAGDDGLLIAICGTDQEIVTATGPGGSYTWTMQPRAGQIDQGKTVLLCAVICLAIGAGVAIALVGASPTFVFPPMLPVA